MTHTPLPPGTPIADDDTLRHYWHCQLGPDGFGYRSLWVQFLDGDDLTLPVIMPIDDIPLRPDPDVVGNLMSIIAQLRDNQPGLGVAIALTRPGAHRRTYDDIAWAVCLIEQARAHRVRMWPVHLATANRVQAFTPDDLAQMMAASTQG